MKTVYKVLAALGCLIACLPLLAGPVPFTAGQFPVWYSTQTAPVTATGTAQTTLFQTTLPPSAAGTSGFIRFTLFVGTTDLNNNHSIIGYFGGGSSTNIPPTGATPIFTNTFVVTPSQPVVEFLLPYNSAVTNRVWNSDTTNSFVSGRHTYVVGTGTNGLTFTLTGSGADPTNLTTLDGVIVEALAQP